jgi:membrane associated rhomboid family serine protease
VFVPFSGGSGTGLAWCAAVGGLIGCLLDLSRAVCDARRRRKGRITANGSP